MASKAKTLARTAISFFLAAFFLYLAFRGVNFRELWNSLLNVKYAWVSLLIPVTILGFWVRALRWAYLLAPIKTHLSQRNLFSAVAIGFMINNILPRAGEFIRAFAIGRLENISKTSAFGTVVVERILDFISFYFLVLVIMAIYPGVLDPFINYFNLPRPFLFLAAIAFFLFFVLMFFKGEHAFRFLLRVTSFLPSRYHERLERLRDSFLAAFGVAKMRQHFGAIFSLSLLLQATYAVGLYIPFFAFDSIRAQHLDFGASVILLTISSIAYILPAPGAMGTYHSFVTVALTNLYGIDRTTALSFSLITHEVGYIVTAVVGLYYFLKDHLTVSDVALQTTESGQA